jgi:hypothetical protein
MVGQGVENRTSLWAVIPNICGGIVVEVTALGSNEDESVAPVRFVWAADTIEKNGNTTAASAWAQKLIFGLIASNAFCFDSGEENLQLGLLGRKVCYTTMKIAKHKNA